MRTRSASKFVATALLGLAVVAALATYVKMSGGDKVPQSQHRVGNPDVQVRSSRAKPAPQAHAYVFEPVYQGEDLKFEKRTVDIPLGEDPRAFVITQFLKRTAIVETNVRLLSVEIKDGLANLYFNGDIQQTLGSEDESVVVNGIAACLGQFPDVTAYLIYADGELVETLGHFDLTEPIKVKRFDSLSAH